MDKRIAAMIAGVTLVTSMTPVAVYGAGSEDYGFDVTTGEEAAQKNLEKEQAEYDKLKNECAEKEADYNEKKEAADTARQEYDVAKAEKQAADQRLEVGLLPHGFEGRHDDLVMVKREPVPAHAVPGFELLADEIIDEQAVLFGDLGLRVHPFGDLDLLDVYIGHGNAVLLQDRGPLACRGVLPVTALPVGDHDGVVETEFHFAFLVMPAIKCPFNREPGASDGALGLLVVLHVHLVPCPCRGP